MGTDKWSKRKYHIKTILIDRASNSGNSHNENNNRKIFILQLVVCFYNHVIVSISLLSNYVQIYKTLIFDSNFVMHFLTDD